MPPMPPFFTRNFLPKTGQTTVYTTNDDGTYKKGYIVNPRFVDNGDGTISDRGTGLTWVKDPVTDLGTPFDAAMDFDTAIANCEALNFAGYSDWRLPNIRELQSIIDYGLNSPCMDPIFTTLQTFYWTSTTYSGWAPGAWALDFGYSPVMGDAKTNSHWARPVRAGQ